MEANDLKKKLFRNKDNAWEKVEEEEKTKIFDFSKKYIEFLSNNKTERECVKTIKEKLEKNNFKNIETLASIKSGDKIYYINREKSVFAAVIGEESPEEGFNIIGAHIDSPRLDLKPNPIYEDAELALFKTHYYGGIKKYQWVNIPRSMHGVIIKEMMKK